MSLLPIFFCSCLLISFLVVGFASRPKAAEKQVRERVELLVKRAEVTGEAAGVLREPEPTAGLAAKITLKLSESNFSQQLQKLMIYAGKSESTGAFVLTSIALAVGGGFASHMFIGPLPVVLAITALAGAAKYFLLRFQASRRLNKFNEALPDAIELMTRALRAGHAMPSSIEIIAEQSPEPLAAEFANCFQQQKFGIPFRDAMLEMAERVPSKDLHFLVTAILVQKETGGDLTEILDRATAVIRDRVRIEGEIRTYTAQGRLTGWILGALPIIMLGLINLVTPGYSSILFHDPTGQMLLYAGAGLIGIGGFIITKIVDIKV